MHPLTVLQRTLSVLAAVALLGGCALNPATGRQELALITVSPAEEIALGEKTFPQALQQMGGEYPDPDLNAYVNAVGVRLGRLSGRPDLPYRVRVVNDSSPNAFALPGGFIAVSRGLLVNLDNEAQLAAVLGHEVGHVDARHAVQGMQRDTLFGAGLAVLSGVTGQASYGPLARQAGEMATALLDRSYSREQERESDRLGIDTMVRAGYDPAGAVQLQEFFYRKVEKGAEPDWLGGMFRTHPFSRDRLDANRSYIAATYPQALGNSGYRLGAEELQAATAGIREAQKGYALYDQAQALEKQGDAGRAIATYLQAASVAPDQGLILTALGMAYLRADDLASARRHLAQAVHLDGNYYASRLGLGYVYLQQEKGAAAVKEFEASMALLPTLQGGYLLAEGYEKTGKPAKAAELYRAVAEADGGGKLGRAAGERLRILEGALMDWTTLLQPGERLVWEGRPAPRCYTMRNWRHALFGVILLVPTLYWQVVALQLAAVYHLPLIPWIPLPFLLAALYLALGQLFVARLEWENVFYAVTDRRILAQRGFLRVRHLVLDLDAVGSFVLKPYGEELASLRIVAVDSSTTLVLSCIEYPRLVTRHLEAAMAATGRLAGQEPPSSAGETG